MPDQTPAPPRLEARIEALERLSMALHARIAELSQDMTVSFRQAADEQLQADIKIEARFNQLERNLTGMEARILAAFKDAITIFAQGQSEEKKP